MARPYPGILTAQGSRGAYELIELPTGLPSAAMMAACFLLAMLFSLLIGMLRNWLDPQREAWRAVRWAFGSASLNIAAIVLLGLTALATARSAVGQGDEIMAALMIACTVLLAVPFFALNKRTLSDPSPARWWSPAWPGWIALLATVFVLIVSVSTGWALELLRVSGVSGGMRAMAEVCDSILSFFLWLLATVVWLDRGDRHAVLGHWRRVVSWPVLRLLIWQSLLMLMAFLALMVPVLLLAVLAIYVVPQYEQWAQQSGKSLAAPLAFAAGFARASGYGALAAWVLTLGFYSLLAQGRVLRGRGVGA